VSESLEYITINLFLQLRNCNSHTNFTVSLAWRTCKVNEFQWGKKPIESSSPAKTFFLYYQRKIKSCYFTCI